jgi:hypothetical protein
MTTTPNFSAEPLAAIKGLSGEPQHDHRDVTLTVRPTLPAAMSER